MKTILVTGTDTGVGKTWVACLLVRRLREQGLRVGAYKPVCSGAELNAQGGNRWSDVDALRAACGNEPSADLICPQRFAAPVAPNIAAKLENRTVSNELLMSGLERWNTLADVLVVEGAGGIYCPLSDSLTVMDLAEKLQNEVIVVAANRLGVISHTRLTVEAIRSAGLPISSIVLNEVSPPTDDSDSSRDSNALQLAKWIPGIPLLHCTWKATELTRVLI